MLKKEEIMKKGFPILLVLLILLVPTITIAGAVEHPVLTGHITDNAGIINPEYRQKIGDLLNRIEQESTAQVAVLTIKSLEGEDKAAYTTEVGQKSGIGQSDVDNGLLLLIAMDDGLGNGKGAYFVATGYGLEGTLPDATVTQINNEVLLPYLKKGKETGDITYYGKGIYEEMSVFEGLLTNNSEVVSKYGSSSSGSTDIGIIGWIVIIIAVLIVLIFFAALLSSGGGGSGGYSGGSDYGGGGGGGSSGGDSGFGGGGFGGGGSGGGFKHATGTVARTSSSSSRRSSSSTHRSSSYNSGFGGGGFRSGGGGFGGGKFGGGGGGGGF